MFPATIVLPAHLLNISPVRAVVVVFPLVPVIAAICAAKALGAKKGKLIKYQTSGESTGDYSSVVGYAGITIS